MAKELCGNMVTAHIKINKDEEEQVSYKIKQHSQIAKLIAEEFQGRLGYDHQVQDWSHFDGHAWIPAPDGQAEELISGYFDKEDWPVGTSDSCFRGSVSRLQKANYLKIPPAIHGVVPFQNGLFDLTTKNITPITHDNAQRWCLPYDYSATSGCPTFLAWLKSVFPAATPAEKKEQAEKILTIQAFINACVTGKSHLQIYLHLQGVARSGKSTLARLIESLFAGEAVAASSLKKLTENKFENLRLASPNIRLLILAELQRYLQASWLQTLKTITGRDRQSTEDKNVSVRKTQDFIFQGQVILTSNPATHWPADDTAALVKRARIIEFSRPLPEAEQAAFEEQGGEKNLQREAAGIINWALELSDKQVNSILINPPQAIISAARRAEFSGTGLSAFVRDRLIFDPKEKTLIGFGSSKVEHGIVRYGSVEDERTMLLPCYLKYCADHMIKPNIDHNSFGNYLIETALRLFSAEIEEIKRERSNKGMCIKGLRIANEWETPQLITEESC